MFAHINGERMSILFSMSKKIPWNDEIPRNFLFGQNLVIPD